jgi:hypothetical protein
VLHNGVVTPGMLARDLLVWSSATAFALWWTFRRVTRAVTINGG